MPTGQECQHVSTDGQVIIKMSTSAMSSCVRACEWRLMLKDYNLSNHCLYLPTDVFLQGVHTYNLAVSLRMQFGRACAPCIFP